MKNIIEVEGKLNKNCTRTQITYCFHVDQPLKEMRIIFSYKPKFITDKSRINDIFESFAHEYPEEDRADMLLEHETVDSLNNLLSLSLDDEEGFRGAAHRHSPNQEIVISKDQATEGFIIGDIKRGLWRVTISAHAVLSENVTYTLKVLGQ